MLKTIILTVILFSLINSASANSFSGIVQFNYDYILDGHLLAKRQYKLNLDGDELQLNGHYVDLQNDSKWTFKFYKSRGTTIVSALQLDGSFYRVMAGEVADNKIKGTWFAAGGLKGDFEILKN